MAQSLVAANSSLNLILNDKDEPTSFGENITLAEHDSSIKAINNAVEKPVTVIAQEKLSPGSPAITVECDNIPTEEKVDLQKHPELATEYNYWDCIIFSGDVAQFYKGVKDLPRHIKIPAGYEIFLTRHDGQSIFQRCQKLHPDGLDISKMSPQHQLAVAEEIVSALERHNNAMELEHAQSEPGLPRAPPPSPTRPLFHDESPPEPNSLISQSQINNLQLPPMRFRRSGQADEASTSNDRDARKSVRFARENRENYNQNMRLAFPKPMGRRGPYNRSAHKSVRDDRHKKWNRPIYRGHSQSIGSHTLE